MAVLTLRRCAWIAVALLSLAAVAGARAQAPPPSPTEYQVKAVFLFNFSQFVDWPPGAFADSRAPLVIGVLGPDPFGATLDEIVRGETVNGRPLAVRRYQSVDQVAACHILFIDRSQEPQLEGIVAALKDRSVLTVGDFDGFARRGGIVRFITVGNRIRLRINLAAAQHAQLDISSKLLRPAEIVGPGQD
ncbi:MAG TPA: YfiR family protein [Steroidobacteraceae bacterium]|nr:YfiR family protein [Steroidobacteraceae bacterium]